MCVELLYNVLVVSAVLKVNSTERCRLDYLRSWQQHVLKIRMVLMLAADRICSCIV